MEQVLDLDDYGDDDLLNDSKEKTNLNDHLQKNYSEGELSDSGSEQGHRRKHDASEEGEVSDSDGENKMPPRNGGRYTHSRPMGPRNNDRELGLPLSEQKRFLSLNKSQNFEDEEGFVIDPETGQKFKPYRRCRYFASGRCTYGNECKFLHDKGPLTERDLYSAKQIKDLDMDPHALHNVKLKASDRPPRPDIDRAIAVAGSRDSRHHHPKAYPPSGGGGGLLGDRPDKLTMGDARNLLQSREHAPKRDPTYAAQKQRDGAMNAEIGSTARDSWALQVNSRRAAKGLITAEELERQKMSVEAKRNSMGGGLLGDSPYKPKIVKSVKQLEVEIELQQQEIKRRKAKIEADEIRNLGRNDSEDTMMIERILSQHFEVIPKLIQKRVEVRKQFKMEMKSLKGGKKKKKSPKFEDNFLIAVENKKSKKRKAQLKQKKSKKQKFIVQTDSSSDSDSDSSSSSDSSDSDSSRYVFFSGDQLDINTTISKLLSRFKHKNFLWSVYMYS